MCISNALGGRELERFEGIAEQNNAIHKGDQVFRSGEPLRVLHVLRSGCVKSSSISEDGAEQIIRFHLPGEMLGLNSVGTGFHHCTATALDSASVCEIPYRRLQDMADRIPVLNQRLFRMMSREIERDEQLLMLLGKKSASERVARFLVNLSQLFGQRGFSTREFNLTMARREIANYLGLTVETVSRSFRMFQDEGALEVEGKHITVRDPDCLYRLGGLPFQPAARVSNQ
ncbi:MAG: fumarate/nitrate reduction transcriptional regulator Fnr [Chromatiales bacterium]|nr:fumarate/nitrate reduction transcriptional regulator Fnr [Chromatiales bacterium]